MGETCHTLVRSAGLFPSVFSTFLSLLVNPEPGLEQTSWQRGLHYNHPCIKCRMRSLCQHLCCRCHSQHLSPALPSTAGIIPPSAAAPALGLLCLQVPAPATRAAHCSCSVGACNCMESSQPAVLNAALTMMHEPLEFPESSRM